MNFSNDVPIYLQLAKTFKMFVLTGEWKKGEKIQTVRELSSKYGVNPNTIQRALMELENENLVYCERTNGRFVADNVEYISELRQEMAQKIIKTFFEDMGKIGYSNNEVLNIISREVREVE